MKSNIFEFFQFRYIFLSASVLVPVIYFFLASEILICFIFSNPKFIPSSNIFLLLILTVSAFMHYLSSILE